MPASLKNVLKEKPDIINYMDWENPRLKGHKCPHCNSDLQYNPYIIQT